MGKVEKGKERKARSAGVDFPPDTQGSSSTASKAILSAAMLVPENGPEGGNAAQALKAERDWRWGYSKHLVTCHTLAARSPEAALGMARAGLDFLLSNFRFVRGGNSCSLLAAVGLAQCNEELSWLSGTDLSSTEVQGVETTISLKVPYQGGSLHGKRLISVLQSWQTAGFMEADAAKALQDLAASPGWDLRGQHFVLLGASSQMGPCAFLLSMGATVHAVDLPEERVWTSLITMARNSPGTLVVPTPSGIDGHALSDEELARVAGLNLETHLPEATRWVSQQAPGQRLVIVNLLYLDGASFIRVAAAADALTAAVLQQRPDAALSLLCSPSECYVVPKDALKEARSRYSSLSPHQLWYRPVQLASGGRYLAPYDPTPVPQATGDPLLILDSYVWQQGPNYAVAKLLQRWRVMVARAQGHVASANVGPASLTKSVLGNRLVAAGMYGCSHFGVFPFESGTASSLLGLLLVHDLNTPTSAAHPTTTLRSPLELFTRTSLHGGVWRAAFHTNSYTEPAALVYVANRARLMVYAGAALAVGLKLRSRL